VLPVHALDLVFNAHEVLELGLEFIERRLLRLERLVCFRDVILPTPLVLRELKEILVALVLRRLDAARQQQDHLQDLTVLSDAVVERALGACALDRRQVRVEDELDIFGDGHGVPSLNHLRALQDGYSASVDGCLNFLH